jgi:hypothetical protein
MDNKQVAVKPNVMFELLTGKWCALGHLSFFESLLDKSTSPLIIGNDGSPFSFGMPDLQNFDNLKLEIPFSQPGNDDLDKFLLLLFSFSRLWVQLAVTGGMSKRYCFIKIPSISLPN